MCKPLPAILAISSCGLIAAAAVVSAATAQPVSVPAVPTVTAVPAARMPTDDELRAVRRQMPTAADLQRAVQEQQRPRVRVITDAE